MSFIRRFTPIFGVIALVFSMQAFAAQQDNTIASDNASSQIPATVTAIANDKVNINTANADELGTLKGVGASKAQAIIDYRTQHGAFKSADELANVKGISGKILANLLKNNAGRIVVE